MIRTLTLAARERFDDTPARRPTVWGLDARQLHDAYWRSWGVQCVRRGGDERLSRAAELYLLIEPEQMVLFDLPDLVDRLVWHRAAVTRLRIVDQDSEEYGERVIIDDRGLVQRVERRYGSSTRATYRVLLTPHRRIAALWMVAANRREGWDAARRSVAWARVDHFRCPGSCFTEGSTPEEQDLITRLVARWRDPDQVLEGIEKAGPGVWKVAGDRVDPEAVLIEPLWIGKGAGSVQNTCVVGPAFLPDQSDGPDTEVRPRDIATIELDEDRRPHIATDGAESGYAFAKRVFDIVFSLLVLILALPMFIVVGLCIVIEDGPPVYYGHTRQTRGGKLFKCWKFRTMKRNAEQLTPDVAEKNVCDGPQVFIIDDPRVTKVGGLLRRFQIDEFPQFWNVLLGQMSVVGPRPSPDDENQYCPAWRDLRLSVRPGITGLWQLSRTRAPGEDFQEWIKYDLEYVRQASFWFDMKICAKTVWLLLSGARN